MTKDNNAKFVLLGLLSHEPMTGYDIKKVVSLQMSYFWDLSYGQIYPTLDALEKDGLISRKEEIKEHGPNRKVYALTAEGIEELGKWLAKPAKKEMPRYEILLRLYFGSQTTTDTNIKQIADFKARNTQNLETMKLFEENLKSVMDKSEDHFYMLLTVLLGKAMFQSSVEWADTALKMLEQRSGRR